VRDRGDHCPCGVRVELARWGVREGLVDEVADVELNRCVIAVPSLNDSEALGAVSQRGVMAPCLEELRMVADEADAADDQPLLADGRLSDLRLPGFGVVRQDAQASSAIKPIAASVGAVRRTLIE